MSRDTAEYLWLIKLTQISRSGKRKGVGKEAPVEALAAAAALEQNWEAKHAEERARRLQWHWWDGAPEDYKFWKICWKDKPPELVANHTALIHLTNYTSYAISSPAS
ncbi:hypothetical protein B0H67DRAFT_640608 [Lasiosphaeris hirsuta]|uniref:Uncharacterized protein n=1 Tax=Lasiosphaeris hirsuta TaxID=260670 RepID=A0AA40BDN6_9PEZI|nr:hypothetical protein B0H67DRAFT_640608 [Lasiosphaeris hirsuta]